MQQQARNQKIGIPISTRALPSSSPSTKVFSPHNQDLIKNKLSAFAKGLPENPNNTKIANDLTPRSVDLSFHQEELDDEVGYLRQPMQASVRWKTTTTTPSNGNRLEDGKFMQTFSACKKLSLERSFDASPMSKFVGIKNNLQGINRYKKTQLRTMSTNGSNPENVADEDERVVRDDLSPFSGGLVKPLSSYQKIGSETETPVDSEDKQERDLLEVRDVKRGSINSCTSIDYSKVIDQSEFLPKVLDSNLVSDLSHEFLSVNGTPVTVLLVEKKRK